MKATALLFGAAILALASCKKDSPKPASSNCLLQSIESSDNSYSEKINYDGNKQVVSVELTGSDYTSLVPAKDANGRVYKVDYYTGTTQSLETIDQFDANSRITLVSYYQQGALEAYVAWTYASGNRPTEEKQYTLNNGNTTLTATIDYTYDARGNVLSGDGTSYTYDDKPCAIRALSFLPAVLAGNQNNMVTQVTKGYSGNVTASVNSTYTYDSNGNPTQRKDIDNYGVSSVYNYAFLCQ